MEGTVKARLLLASALFLFVQISTMQAQVTVDVVKITCEQLEMQALPFKRIEHRLPQGIGMFPKDRPPKRL